jgi:hypothetical protein
MKLAIDIGAGRRNAAARGRGWANGQADAEIECWQIAENAGSAGLRQLILARGKRPGGAECAAAR